MNHGLAKNSTEYVHRVSMDGYYVPPANLSGFDGCILVDHMTAHNIKPDTKRLFFNYPCTEKLKRCADTFAVKSI